MSQIRRILSRSNQNSIKSWNRRIHSSLKSCCCGLFLAAPNSAACPFHSLSSLVISCPRAGILSCYFYSWLPYYFSASRIIHTILSYPNIVESLADGAGLSSYLTSMTTSLHWSVYRHYDNNSRWDHLSRCSLPSLKPDDPASAAVEMPKVKPECARLMSLFSLGDFCQRETNKK